MVVVIRLTHQVAIVLPGPSWGALCSARYGDGGRTSGAVILANLKYFFAGQNLIFWRIFLVFAGHPRFFQNIPKKSLALHLKLLFIHLILAFCIKMLDTNFAGHIAEFAGQQDIYGKNAAKSRMVGNYEGKCISL